jgi:hypothetical protein
MGVVKKTAQAFHNVSVIVVNAAVAGLAPGDLVSDVVHAHHHRPAVDPDSQLHALLLNTRKITSITLPNEMMG